MANNLTSGDLVVAKIRTGESRFETVSARVLRVIGDQSVAIQINGLDTKNPLWGCRLVVDQQVCEKSHQ